MTQCVVYIDTPIRSENSMRSRAYVNEFGSLGMHEHFWEQDRHVTRFNTLDSRVIRFDSPKEAEQFAQGLANSEMMGNARDEIGYHGITENGNACTPFKVVQRAETHADVERKRKSLHKRDELYDAYASCFLPWPINTTQVSTGRVGYITWEDMLAQISRYTDNMVEEELVMVYDGLTRLRAAGFQITAIEEHEEIVNVHASRANPHTSDVLHYSATICAFNLWDAAGIAMLKDLRKRNEAHAGTA